MGNREQQIADFFHHYCEVFNRALSGKGQDTEHIAELFSTCFIAANPSGVNCGQNNETFLDAMQKGYAFYRSIGMASMDIVSREITLLDDLHTMVRVRWRSTFLKGDGLKTTIEFENIYFTQTRDTQHKVFAYITGDEQAALKSAGLV
jgi:hypothetical protein